jgi:pyrroline-5-carboxylate reductase
MWTEKLAFIGAGNIAEVIIDRLVALGSAPDCARRATKKCTSCIWKATKMGYAG